MRVARHISYKRFGYGRVNCLHQAEMKGKNYTAEEPHAWEDMQTAQTCQSIFLWGSGDEAVVSPNQHLTLSCSTGPIIFLFYFLKRVCIPL